jgi:hypothetical protein
MTSLILALTLLAPPGIYYQGTVGSGSVAPAGLTLVATYTAADTTMTTGASVPVTASVGDLIVVIEGCGSDGGQCGNVANYVSGVAGATLGAFTLAGQWGGWTRVTAYYKVATVAVTAESVTFTRPSVAGLAHALGAYVFRGFNTTTPIGAVGTYDNPTPAQGSITPQAAGSYIIWASGQDGGAATLVANANSQVDLGMVSGTLQAATVGRSLAVTPSTAAISIGATNTGISHTLLMLEVRAQ